MAISPLAADSLLCPVIREVVVERRRELNPQTPFSWKEKGA